METISVLLVDDHRVVRQGLRDFLELHETIDVVGEASSGEEGVQLARELLPDVVLMDLMMPGGIGGVEATRRLTAACPNTRVIVLTSFADDDNIFPAIKAGAISYLLKDISPEQLAHAVFAAQRNEAVLHPDVAARLMQEFHGGSGSAPNEQLTEREMDVLRLIARGKNNKEIADALVISEKTVKTHVSNLLSKLHLADRTNAAIYALRKRLVPMDDGA